MQGKTIDLPPEVAALIPDVVESNNVSPKAQQAIKEIESDCDNRADRMLEAAKSIHPAKVAINGIFKHPPEFTEEEWDIIIAGLKAHLPLYAIAMKVHCERHFLARKIQECKEAAQVVIDAKEGVIDETEFQLYKAARSGSMSAVIYILDHLGKDRGWGEQQESKEQVDDVQIVFGEISDKDLVEAKQKISEAEKKVTPTLAGELANLEVPQKATVQDLAMAEDIVKSMEKANERKPVEVKIESTSLPPYKQQTPQEDRYDFLESAFAEGGDSPFALM